MSGKVKYKISDAQLITELNRLANELKKTPTVREMSAKGKYSGMTYCKRFGKWTRALKKAGLSCQNVRITDKQLIDEMKRLSKELNRPPRISDMNSLSKYNPSTYRGRFGSWKEALYKAGFKHSFLRISDEQLLNELKRLAKILKRIPNTKDIKTHNKFAIRTYYRRFSSLNEAIKKAGIE